MKRLALLGLVFLFAACSARPGSVGPPSQPASTPADGALPANARYVDLSTPVGGCAGGAQDRLAVLEVNSGPDFHAVLPGALSTPELDDVKAPLGIVIYKDGWPGPITGVPGAKPEKPTPGTWDVCVAREDGGDIGGLPFIVYGSVKSAGSSISAQ